MKWIALSVLALTLPSVAIADITIKRLYKSSRIAHTAIIQTSDTVMVKCSLYDSSDNPLSVEEAIVTPPVDQIVIGSRGIGDQVASVKCWTVE